jgi:Domain of unknown function (DUF4258)
MLRPGCHVSREQGSNGVEAIRGLIRTGKYEFSIHAEQERQADKITIEELEAALTTCEIIEDYPDDPRGASWLVLGFAAERPIHVVCALKRDPEEVFLITIYDPSLHSEKWSDNYQRRRRQ